MKAHVEVTITKKQGHLVGAPDPVHLQRQTKDEIVWINATDVDCWVSFRTSPLDVHDIRVNAGKKGSTHRVRDDANAGIYDYDLAEASAVKSHKAWLAFARSLEHKEHGKPVKLAGDPQVIVH